MFRKPPNLVLRRTPKSSQPEESLFYATPSYLPALPFPSFAQRVLVKKRSNPRHRFNRNDIHLGSATFLSQRYANWIIEVGLFGRDEPLHVSIIIRQSSFFVGFARDDPRGEAPADKRISIIRNIPVLHCFRVSDCVIITRIEILST